MNTSDVCKVGIAIIACGGKLLSSGGQTFFAMMSFIYHVTAEQQNLECHTDPRDPACPDEYAPLFLTIYLHALIANLSVVSITRLLNLWKRTTECTVRGCCTCQECCEKPPTDLLPLTSDAAVSSPDDNKVVTQAPHNGQKYYFANLNYIGKFCAGALITLGILSGFSVALNGYFSAVKLMQFLVYLGSGIKNHDSWGLQVPAIIVFLSSFLSYFAYNIRKVAQKAIKLASTINCCLKIPNLNIQRNWGLILLTTLIMLPQLGLAPMNAFFGTSHSIQGAGQALKLYDLVNDISDHSNLTNCIINHNYFNNTNITSIDPPPSAFVDYMTAFTLPSAITYVLLTSVFSIYEGLTKLCIKMRCSNQSSEIKSQPINASAADDEKSPNVVVSSDFTDQNPSSSPCLDKCLYVGNIWFWFAGISDTIYSACGGYIAVISIAASINKGHLPFIQWCVDSDTRFSFAIANAICAALGNLAFNIYESYNDFIEECVKYGIYAWLLDGLTKITGYCRKQPEVDADNHSPLPSPRSSIGGDTELAQTSVPLNEATSGHSFLSNGKTTVNGMKHFAVLRTPAVFRPDSHASASEAVPAYQPING